jgi:class 3 adenylate cyclase
MNDIIAGQFAKFNNTEIIEKLKTFVIDSEIEKLFHIDVYGLADSLKIPRKELLEIFFRGVSYGIFDMQWNFHCPKCGGVAQESLRLEETHSEDHCPVCEIDFNNALDDNIEVFFNINGNLRIIPEEIQKDYMDKIIHTVTHDQIFEWNKPTTIPGLECINNNVFREIFGEETLPADQSLEIKYATILFTDITGSTAMYEKLGDAKAYQLVREHFDILFNNIKKNNGVPIKTIGDAVMGVFISEADAIDAAFKSQIELMKFYNEKNQDEKIEVKVGLHSGPTLVVTLNNRLDYFGSTVNTAARIQGLSKPNQIVLSDNIYNNNKKTLLKYITKITSSNIELRGLSGKFKIYRADCAGDSCKR